MTALLLLYMTTFYGDYGGGGARGFLGSVVLAVVDLLNE